MNRIPSIAFTLIELLIVVAIISILAAIAIPNFLEAQTRARISRAKADIRTIATAVETYYVDNNAYPYPLHPYKESLSTVYELSTPIAYLSTIGIPDSFMPFNEDLNPPPPPAYMPTYMYDNYSGAFMQGITIPEFRERAFKGYCILSCGPDRIYGGGTNIPLFIGTPQEKNVFRLIYDPTNGTVSSGDIAYWSGKHAIPGSVW